VAGANMPTDGRAKGEVKMAVDLDIRSGQSSVANEIYISAGSPVAGKIFNDIAEILRSKNAYIMRERIFVPKKPAEKLLRLRSQIYGALDDGVAPTILVGKRQMSRPITAVQVHAIRSDSRPEVIDVPRFRGGKAGGRPDGRILHVPGCTYLTLSGISAGPCSISPRLSAGVPRPVAGANMPTGGRAKRGDDATEQARAMMEKAESALKQAGSDFFSVARTWMWLGRILSWYGQFNRVRNEFFTQRGLIPRDFLTKSRAGARQSMPASTGIGLRPADGSKCAMDLIAVLEPRDSIRHLQAAGKQQCALEYGSAFSRASRAITPAGETIFVSGTASIDASGATTHIDDPLGQIKETIKNVRAVLKDTAVSDEDVVQAVAYCKTAEVEQIFNDLGSRGAGSLKSTQPSAGRDWPWVTVICDICRPDLLFEVEVTALKAAKTR